MLCQLSGELQAVQAQLASKCKRVADMLRARAQIKIQGAPDKFSSYQVPLTHPPTRRPPLSVCLSVPAQLTGPCLPAWLSCHVCVAC